MTVAAVQTRSATESTATRFVPWVGFVTGVVVLQAIGNRWEEFPARWDSLIEAPIDDAGAWLRSNRLSHPLFTGFFTPISKAIGWMISASADALLWMPWFVVLAIVFAIPARKRMYRSGAIAAAALAYTGLIGLWDDTMRTLALMSAAVLLAVVIGLPLGMWAALNRRVETTLRPILDAMQTIPAFVYFLPLFMLLGIGDVPGAVATLIYALPPVVRLTTLGIQQVPAQAVEASKMSGATTRQTLFKVQLPMAVQTIITGLTQTIMLALGIVVLATLVGSKGLGSPVLQSLNQRRTGRGMAAGLAIVAVAIVLDRIWKSAAVRDPLQRVSRRTTLIGVGGIVATTVVARLVGIEAFPDVWEPRLFDPIDDAVTWLRDNMRWFTRGTNDFIVIYIYLPARNFLTETVAWPALVFVVGWSCWRVKGLGLAAFASCSLLLIGLLGLWALSIDTLVQVLIGAGIAVAISVPIGVYAGRNPKIEAAISPILDALQTIPSFVYIIPVATLFTVGVVPGVIATVAYAMVPGVRITALGIREVPVESLEASRTFGATPRQTMLGVRIPLAAPTILAAINQVIMLSLAMVIISGLAGGGALGFETVRALKRSLFGYGFEVGLALALMAMILDRFTEALGNNLRPPTN